MANGCSVARYLTIVERVMGPWEKQRLNKLPAWARSLIEKMLNEIEQQEVRAEKAELFIQIESLRDSIRFHAHLYYNQDRAEISDSQYDKMFKRLQELEEKHPKLVTPNSPTQLVGEEISAPLREKR